MDSKDGDRSVVYTTRYGRKADPHPDAEFEAGTDADPHSREDNSTHIDALRGGFQS
jgi:hypothetical protein